MKRIFVLFSIVFLSGCAAMKEDAKIVWGSSTQALEEERPNAVRKTFSCSPSECFDLVLKFANSESGQTKEPVKPATAPSEVMNSPYTEPALAPHVQKMKTFDVFLKDRKRNLIVVMGVPDHVNTTEVGIFFTPAQGGTLVEVTSLSTAAKVKAAEMIFTELAKNSKDISL